MSSVSRSALVRTGSKVILSFLQTERVQGLFQRETEFFLLNCEGLEKRVSGNGDCRVKGAITFTGGLLPDASRGGNRVIEGDGHSVDLLRSEERRVGKEC